MRHREAKSFTHGAASPIAVVYRPLRELKLDPLNPRVHSLKQIRQIAESIRVFGCIVPVLVDADLNVIAGHGRIRACQQLGLSEVPTIRLEHLTRAQARAFMIADNKLTENSAWDDQLLAEQLKDLAELELDFDLEVTGFEMGEIDLRIEGLVAAVAEGEDTADAVPAARQGPPVSRPGDIWLLGNHRVICGNALEATTYARLMRGKKAAMVFTDPPYNVAVEGHASGLGAVRHSNFAMASGELNEQEFTAFLTSACRLMKKHSRGGSIHFVCMDWRHMRELLDAGQRVCAEEELVRMD